MKDAFSQFSKNQVITASAVSTNVIDLGDPKTVPGAPAALKRDIGGGNNVPVEILVTEDFATLTSLEATIQTSDDEAFSGSVDVATTGAIPVASLVDGYQLPISMLPQYADKRYLRISYTVAGSNATTGQIMAGLVFGTHTNG